MISKYLIYGLVDPRDGQLRYVGKSCSGEKRPSAAWPRSLKGYEGKTHKVSWVQGLHVVGLKPQIVVLQEFQDADLLADAERHWIRYFRQMGFPLTNLTDGGDGAPGHRKTPETIARMRAGAYRRWGRPEGLNENRLIGRYLEGRTLREVAAEFTTSSSMVFQVLKRNGIQIRPRKGLKRRAA